MRRILIANRGEIAGRIIRTCRALGIDSVLTVSEADRTSLPARLADRAVCIGPSRSADSYLRVNTIVQAALGTGADAIHPGYGFLSERPELARACEEHGIVFIGPTAAQIEAVGDKLRARAVAEAAGVPVVPGGPIASLADAQSLASTIGTPLLLKAVGGGGGRGMKRVDCLADLPGALELASSEAGAAFGDARLYLERFVARGRHIEVQVLGDGAGAVIHLGERDCSVQRRYQKLAEESPAPGLTDSLRAALHAAAVSLAQRLCYRGAGTVEFLVDPDRQAFYFLEMNARIQVEHPVTEAVSGLDLVARQIAIAAGDGLGISQEQVRCAGCALECRINAEDPRRDFQPSPGVVTDVSWSSGPDVRVDTHIEAGSTVPPYYDSLLAKIIVHGTDRNAALAQMRSALGSTRVAGVATNIAFHQRLLDDPEFIAGGVDTGFLSRLLGAEGKLQQRS
ncbi:MAG: ATP-grasp domain-containing protein [Sinobacteraceae bacterium]|nr:ATP-grasp domain-containing protein [Nevskiaceae bacterium]